MRVGVHARRIAGPQFTLAAIAEDEGIGIPADRLAAIFDPFVQLLAFFRKHFGGAALGLYVERRIARALGGAVRAVSQPGRGSSFELTS